MMNDSDFVFVEVQPDVWINPREIITIREVGGVTLIKLSWGEAVKMPGSVSETIEFLVNLTRGEALSP